MPEYKLTYFDARGRGEVCRILLTFAGREFTDNRVQGEDWPALKPETPLGSMPLLDIGAGKTQTRLCQSMAINRYIAKETGLAGKDALQQAQVDMIATTISEILTSILNCLTEPDKTKKAEMEKKQNEVFVPNVLKFLEDSLEKNPISSGYFVGKSVTLADFMAWHVLEYLLEASDKALNKYPKLKENRDLVTELPKFAEYQKKRPKTDF